MADRNVVTHFGADTRSFDEGINRMTSELRDYQKALRENKKEQKDAGAEIKAAEKELAAIEKAIKKTGVETQAQKDRQAELNEIIRQGKQRLDDLKIAQAGLQKEIENSKKKIEEQKKAQEQLSAAMSDAKRYSGELAAEVGVLAGAAVAATAGIMKFVSDAAAWADSMNTMRDVTGISTADLQKFAYASELVDVSMETMTGSLTKLTRNMQTAAGDGTGAAAKAFEELGVSITDSAGQLRDRQDVFYEVIDALGKVGNETERDALAMNIFGKSAEQLNPLIKGGAETLKALGDEAERAGLILDQTTLDKLHGFSDEIDLLKAKGGQITKIVGAEALPAVESLTEAADDLLAEIKQMADSGELEAMARSAGQMIKQGVNDLKNLTEWVLKNKEAVAGAAGAMVGFKMGMSIGGLINSLIVGFKSLKAITDEETASQIALNTAMNTNPIGVVIGLVGALVGGITALTAAQQAAAGAIDKTNEALDSANSAYASAAAQAEGEAAMLEALGKKYDELRDKSKLTGEEKAQLKNISEQLREKLGLTAAQVQDEAGSFRDLTKYINEATEALKRKGQAQAAQAGYEEAFRQRLEAELAVQRAVDEANRKHPGLYDKKGNLIGEWNYDTDETVREVENVKKALVDAGEAMTFYSKKLDEAAAAEGAAANSGKGTAETLWSTSSGAACATEQIENYFEGLLRGEGTLEEFYSMFDNMDEAVEFFSDKLTEANKALEDNKDKLSQARQEKNKYLKELGEGSEDYLKAKNKVSELETEQTKLRITVRKAKADYEAAAQAAKPLSEKLAELAKQSASLRGALSELVGLYDKLNEGQSLDLDTLLKLSESYPDYVAEIISANGNIEKQKTVIEALYEVKKQELILTLRKAREEINASNEVTRKELENAKKRLQTARSLYAVHGSDKYKQEIAEITKTIRELNGELDSGKSKADAYNKAIVTLEGTDIADYKTSGGGTSSGGGGGSSGGGSVISGGKAQYTTSGGGEVGTGDSRVDSMLAWADRMVAMGKISDQGLKGFYENILRTERMTADESYNVRLRLKNLTDKLYDAEVRSKEDAEKKKQEAEKKTAEERKKQQERALAAYEALVKGEIDRLNRANSNIQAAADRRVAEIDSLLQGRQRKKEDDQRKSELAALDRELKYYRGDELAKESLERRRQEILNEQNELNYQRMLESQKIKIQQEANGKIDKNTAAINKLNTSLDSFAYAVAKAAGNLSNSQIVNHNTKNQNIKVVQSAGLTQKQMEQFIKAIYSG